jgi:tRNA-binding protein
LQLVPIKSLTPFAQLEALDVRVGTIERVHDVPNSDKLVRFVVDFGDHKQTVLAWMKKERHDLGEIAVLQAMSFDLG